MHLQEIGTQTSHCQEKPWVGPRMRWEHLFGLRGAWDHSCALDMVDAITFLLDEIRTQETSFRLLTEEVSFVSGMRHSDRRITVLRGKVLA